MLPVNVLVCPVVTSDPVTAMDASPALNALIVGTTSGRVYAYKIDHILKTLLYTLPMSSSEIEKNDQKTLLPSLVMDDKDNCSYPLRFDCERLYQVRTLPKLDRDCCVNCGNELTYDEMVSSPNGNLSNKSDSCRECLDNEQNDGEPLPVDSSETPSHPTVDPSAILITDPETFRCKVLADKADEGVRGIYIFPFEGEIKSNHTKHGTINMTIGDLLVRISTSIHDKHCLNMKFLRRHDTFICDNTYTLVNKHRNVLLVPDDRTNCLILDTIKQKQYLLSNLAIDSKCIPFDFQGNTIAWLEYFYSKPRSDDHTILYSFAHVESQITTHNLVLSSFKNPSASVVSGNRLVCVSSANFVEVFCLIPSDEAQIVMDHYNLIEDNKKDAEYNRVQKNYEDKQKKKDPNYVGSGVQERDMKDYPSLDPPYPNHDTDDKALSNLTTTYDLSTTWNKSWTDDIGRSKIKHRWGDRGSVVEVTRGSYEGHQEELLILSKQMRCIKFLAHKQGVVMGILAENNGEDIITFGSDRKLKLWHKGILIMKFVNCKGTFVSHLPFMIHRVGRMIFYNSDDNVYSIVLPIDCVDKHDKLCLEKYALLNPKSQKKNNT